MIRDPFYRDIIARLNDRDSRIDPDTFERCAADLLRTLYPALVPVRGGSDSGMDGAVADGQAPPFPLVCTTSDRIPRNLRGSLSSYRASGGRRRKAVLATSRPLTPRRRANLFKVAEEEGFRLVQIHDQAAFADLLYRSPGWCRELLALTGEPPALSAVPLTARPILGDAVVGRTEVLEWISDQREDALLVGQPGAGKTHILRAIAKEDGGLFVISEERGELAAAVRAQAPDVLFVDDAHHRRDLLLRLVHLRTELGAEFRILATCWPGEQAEVARTLGLAKDGIRELELLTRRDIAEVIRGCGITGPPLLLRELIDQAEGRPGLAVTLCQLCLRGGVRDLASGTALFEDVRQTFQELVGPEAVEILAGFAVGGDAGMRMQTVADALGFRLVEMRHAVERLAAGGILSETYNRTLVVQPNALRHALVGTVFFGGARALPIEALLDAAPSNAAAALTLVGARGRGASVPDHLMQGLVTATRDTSVWKAYASLGADESRRVLSLRPDLLTDVGWITLRTAPETAVPQLLARAVGDDRPLHAYPEHPLRLIKDWVKDAVPGGGEVVERRRLLLDALLHWHASGAADPVVCLRALALAFEAAFEDHVADPVDRMGLTIRWGGLLSEEIAEIRELWPRAATLLHSCGLAEWVPLRELITHWAYPGMTTRGHIDSETYGEMYAFAQQVMKDVLSVSEGHPGVAGWISNLASRHGWDVPVELDPTFEVLYPQRDHDDLRDGARKQVAAAVALADEFQSDPPEVVAESLARYATVAATVGHTWPRWSGHVARRLSEIVTNPLVWARAMIAAGNRSDVVEPFLGRALREQTPGWRETWNDCYGRSHLRGMAVLSALAEPTVPEDVVDCALEDVTSMDDAISTECLRNAIPESRVLRLLRHPDPALSERMAWAIWHRDPEGEISADLMEDWRVVVVERMEDEHTLKAIFSADPSIAYDWLARRVGTSTGPRNSWLEDEPFATAITLMNLDQRKQLIARVTSDTWPREIVSLLVGRDFELYQLLLERPDLKFHHLEPLRGDPDASWITLARLAVDAGYTPEEIAGATRGMMWSWDGEESAMWTRWAELFRPLADDGDPVVRRIGRAGLSEAEEHLQRARTQERREAVRGR